MRAVRAPNEHPCHKRTVTATVVTASGDEYVATNQCQVAAPCPRQNLPTGVGYELCKPVHAEVRAIDLAGSAARGARLYVQGHDYACEPCKAAAEAAGITEVVVGAPPRRQSISRDIEDLRGVGP